MKSSNPRNEESRVNQDRTDTGTSRMHLKHQFHEGIRSFPRVTQAGDPVSAVETFANENDAPTLLQPGNCVQWHQSNMLARRCMEAFVKEMKEFAREGGFRNCNELVRKAVNDSLADRYLGPLTALLDTPIVVKVRQIISSFIEGKCRPMEFYIHEQIRNDSPGDSSFWKCAICGKRNVEGKKIQRFCVTCGREKGYVGSKKMRKLNECSGIDTTPCTTASTKEEYKKAAKHQQKREDWVGDEGQRKIFLSTPDDYEALAREELKIEIASLLETIKLCTGGDET